MTTNNAVNTSLAGQTGTGAFVGSNSPSLTSAALGTPSSGILSNCTAYPFSSLAGTIAAAQLLPLGGSGVSKLASTTYDVSTASGTQAISGIGFQPSLVIILSNIGSGAAASIGFDNGTNHYCIANNYPVIAGSWSSQSIFSIFPQVSSGNYQVGYISAFSGDGFTITWAKTGSPTGVLNMYFLCFK